MASSDVPLESLLNPITPLAFLPPKLASEFEASRYVFACVLGAWLWDLLMGIPEDIRMFRKERVALSDVAYVLARIASGGFVTMSFLFAAAPLSNCQTMINITGWFGAFALPCNSMLFLLRIRGVFFNSRIITIIFSLLWLSTLASFTAPFTFTANNIGPTDNCIITRVDERSSAGFFSIGVFDTMVFIAITIRILSFNPTISWSERLRTFWSGKNMGRVSRALLQTGQLYYLVTVGGNILVMVIILNARVSATFQGMSTVPNIALQNAMACKVFRLLKLGLIKGFPSNFTSSTGERTRSLQFNTTAALSRDATGRRTVDPDDGGDIHLATFSSEEVKRTTKVVPLPMQITVSRETDVASETKSRRFIY
ncbi:unnamed protein product [Somion occarium]|uniref:Uncharacterized protein n=1 Tax=Somion occarium TaxID=3059160 RepID=A0ABP1DK12_9APHY